MKKKIILTLLGSILVVLFVFGLLIGSFDFTCSKRLGKTNYHIVKSDVNSPTVVFELCYQYPDMEGMFVGILDACVAEVYWNEQYILVTSWNVQNDSIEGYYIIEMLPPVKRGVPWKKTGLLSADEYEQKKQELHLNEKEMKHIDLFD
ncbi:MAG TPA: hypothetical protein K8W04_05490 [Bacteroides reticulotermitis]|nr:hypothetical protein [Bacteroides reticulotermitis]